MKKPILTMEAVSKEYKTGEESIQILNNLNFTIHQGEKVSITGESGSGKSTLLHLAGGLDMVSDGKIIINNEDITYLHEDELSYFRNKTIGFIFQSHYLLEEFSALENVMLPYLMHDYNRKKAKSLALELIESVGMQHRLKHFPSQMSGGERQRIAIARALINKPQIILADEPTGNLDPANADKVVEILLNVSCDHTLVMVTHSHSIARLADTSYALKNGNLEKQ